MTSDRKASGGGFAGPPRDGTTRNLGGGRHGPPVPSDGELQSALERRDEQVLEQWLAHEKGFVEPFMRRRFRLAREDTLVDDAIHHAVMQVWGRPGLFDPGKGRMRNYFTRIVECECIRRLRERKADALVHYRPNHLLERGEALARASCEFTPRLRRFLDTLSDLERRILAADLRRGASVPAAELAEEFGTTVETVYSLRNRAWKKMRNHLERRGRKP